MNDLEKAKVIAKKKFGKDWIDASEFERKQIVKIIAGTVVWRTEDCFINKENEIVFVTTCSDCGKTTEVPFEPKRKPIYCRACLRESIKTDIEEFNRIYGA